MVFASLTIQNRTKNRMAITIQKPDTNCFRKITIQIPDGPVFEWSLYKEKIIRQKLCGPQQIEKLPNFKHMVRT
jgi:hypothetical protein